MAVDWSGDAAAWEAKPAGGEAAVGPEFQAGPTHANSGVTPLGSKEHQTTLPHPCCQITLAVALRTL